MVESRGPAPSGGVFNSVKLVASIFYCFVVTYLTFLILLIPILIMLGYRFLLSIVFKVFYKGRYKVCEGDNACFGIDRFANVFSLYFFLYVRGPTDIKMLKERMFNIFTTYKVNSRRPYEVMLCSLVKKFGFFCWKNTRDTFDINDHVRFFPGCDDPNKVYTENDLFDAAGRLADVQWDEDKPRWEILVVPQLRKNVTGEIISALHVRFYHAYVDGISAAQLIRTVITDKPSAPFIFDPVNPPIPKTTFIQKLLINLQIFLLGPYASMKFVSNRENHIFYEGPLTGGKFLGRTTMELSTAKMKEIRKYYNCSTSSVQQFALTGAMRRLALKRGYALPEEILGSLVIAVLPYPDQYPTNRAVLMSDKFPIAMDDPIKRLAAVNQVCERTMSPRNFYTIIMSRYFFRIVGSLPTFCIERAMAAFELSYCVSNVPGIAKLAYLNGHEISNVFGTGPLLNGFRYAIGITCYDDKFQFGFQCEKSKFIKSRDDLDELIDGFEQELKYLLDNMKPK